MNVNYDGRRFRGRSNAEAGEVSGRTEFVYHQQGNLLRGEYRGGAVEQGHLLGTVYPDGRLSFVYHHRNSEGTLMAGRCESTPAWEENRLVLAERWQWLTGDRSAGESVVEEILPGEVYFDL